MIVCVCKSVSDRHIRAAIEGGAESLDHLQLELGVALCCGKCRETVETLLGECSACERVASAAVVDFYARRAA